LTEYPLQAGAIAMDIHVVSTLTSDDEAQLAGTLLATLSQLLDSFPIAYALRVETSGALVLQRTNLTPTRTHERRPAEENLKTVSDSNRH
jgi:hypothetical protein